MMTFIYASLISGDNLMANLLIKNAVQAMPNGANVGLCTKPRLGLGNSCFFEIHLSDNVPGHRSARSSQESIISAECRLVLTIANKLVNELGGTISSRAGKGTTYQIFLPRAVISH